MTARYAAQYVRMSTDQQDLSPSVQKEAIAAYASSHDMQLVATYEDEGRSGVLLKNRPALLKLLNDVTGSNKTFSAVLVYDVSRWGRFQDTDAAAYHEYHCRLHGVDVIYVGEMFSAEASPIGALLKSMKRAMAAEYSRELAHKTRAGQRFVVSRGFQIGSLPPLGYRRCSVSPDGQQRVVLTHKQRKLTATDRIEWVLGPREEVELVQRICRMYIRDRLRFTDIARISQAEGWRNHWGCPMRARSIARLLRNEALIGNFVWGRGRQKASLVPSGPSRLDGSVPRLTDDKTWAQIKRRTEAEFDKNLTDDQIVAKLRIAFKTDPFMGTRDLRAHGLPCERTLRTRLGTWDECLARVGIDPAEFHSAVGKRTRQRLAHIKAFGMAIADRLNEAGITTAFDGRLNLLTLSTLTLRPRLMWATPVKDGSYWHANFERATQTAHFDLLVRMEGYFRPKDFLLVPAPDVPALTRPWRTEGMSEKLARYWCRKPSDLIKRLAALQRHPAPTAKPSAKSGVAKSSSRTSV